MREWGWRPWLSLAGGGLAVLPLLQGQWLAAGVAGVFGVLVVGAWAGGTSGGRALGLAVGIGLIALQAGIFAVSQWPRSNLINAPWDDWFLLWLLVSGIALGALAAEWQRHGRNGIIAAGPLAGSQVRPMVLGVAGILTLALLVSGCLALLVLDENEGTLRSQPTAEEIGPLPPTLRLRSASPCTGGGSSGNCRTEFVVTATDGATRAVTAQRLADHLRGVGWPLQPAGDGYWGCREVGGILPWSAHCLSVRGQTIAIDNGG